MPRAIHEVIVLVAAVVTVAACAATTPRSARARSVVETEEARVAQCKPLGQVTGTSELGRAAAITGLKNAQNQALDAAAALGATHLVWLEPTTGDVQVASGIAYRCER